MFCRNTKINGLLIESRQTMQFNRNRDRAKKSPTNNLLSKLVPTMQPSALNYIKADRQKVKISKKAPDNVQSAMVLSCSGCQPSLRTTHVDHSDQRLYLNLSSPFLNTTVDSNQKDLQKDREWESNDSPGIMPVNNNSLQQNHRFMISLYSSLQLLSRSRQRVNVRSTRMHSSIVPTMQLPWWPR